MPNPEPCPGQLIATHRRRNGLSQTQFAMLIGRSLSFVVKVESGEREIHRFTDVIRMAQVLKVDPFRLMGVPIHGLPDDQHEHPVLPEIRAALFGPVDREPIDPAELRAAVEQANGIWHSASDNHGRLGAILPDLIRTARGADHTAADAATRVWLLFRQWAKWVGAYELTMVAAQRCADAAIHANPAAVAAAAWNTGMTYSTRALTEESAQIARDAITVLEPHAVDGGDELAMLGALWLLLAVEASRLRDEHTTATALDTAERIAARTGETNAYRTVFGPTNVAIYRANAALEASRPAEAIRIGERVDVTGLPSMERRFSHPFTLARAYSLRKEDVSAVVMLRRAADEYPQGAASNPVFRATVRAMLRRTTAATRPELHPLAERIGIPV